MDVQVLIDIYKYVINDMKVDMKNFFMKILYQNLT